MDLRTCANTGLTKKRSPFAAQLPRVAETSAPKYTDLAMGVLGLTSCKDLCSDRSFEEVVSIEELFPRLDSFSQDWPFLYLGRNHASIQLHAIGVGSNKQKQERAGRLASRAHICM